MTNHRVNIKNYSGNGAYLGAGMNQYCWGCKAHRAPGGGAILGKLRQWHCAECKVKKEQAKAARLVEQNSITAGNGTTKESNDGR